MDREGFRNRLKQYKLAREENPGLKYWEWKNLPKYDEGGDVMGPPTYEQWDTDMNQYNPTILDNTSMYWSIEAAKKALHNEAMKLPGYAERWTEYYRSLPKNDPDINEFVDELWANENPNNVGLKNGKYYPHKSPEGGKPTIGPGFKLGSGQHKITEKLANRGMTKSRLDQEARRVAKGYFRDVDAAINSGQTTNPADTVSPQIKAGLADILHQTGSLKKWPKLINAVREGDLEKIQNEAIVTWRDNNGVLHEDKRRNELRNKKNWHYAEGGEVEPDPLEVLERSRPKVAGIPINDKPLSGTDPMGEAYLNFVSGNAVRKAIERGIVGFGRKQFYESYLDWRKWGHSRQRAYQYADTTADDIAQGFWKFFVNPSLKVSNVMRSIEQVVE